MASAFGHTPEPWTFKRTDTAFGPRFEVIGGQTREEDRPIHGVLYICDCSTSSSYRFQSEQEANAKLVAAAPRILKALKRLFRADATTLENQGYPPRYWDDHSAMAEAEALLMELEAKNEAEFLVAWALIHGWKVDQALLYDDEGVEGWRWTAPGLEASAIGDWSEPPATNDKVLEAMRAHYQEWTKR
jgi:hypothetical protein